MNEGFILAAGLGTRMKPVTNNIPKPLVKVAGKTLLEYAINKLQNENIQNIVVNTHYMHPKIKSFLDDFLDAWGEGNVTNPNINISHEQTLLGSGGGVKNGLKYVNSKTIIILNADSFWVEKNHSNVGEMKRMWDDKKMDMLLLLANPNNAIGYNQHGDFVIDNDGRLQRKKDNESQNAYAYAGALIANTKIFGEVEEDIYDMNILFDNAIQNGRLFGTVLNDGLWLHVGTPEAIVEAENAIKDIKERGRNNEPV